MQSDDIFIEYDLPKALTKEQIYDYFKQYQNGNLEARKKLIEHNIGLVRYLVTTKFYDTPYEKKDLLSIGLVGLIKGVNTFDISKNLEFSTYASRCINNEIFMFMRKGKKYIHDISFDKVLNDDKDGHELKLEDLLCDENSDFVMDYENREVIIGVRNVVETLSGRDKEIIKLYFGFYGRLYTQKEIGEQFHLTQSQVSRLLLKNLKKVKEQLQKQGIIEVIDAKIKTK